MPYPMTDRMAAAIRDGHVRTSKAVLLNSGKPVMELPVVSGTVSIDNTASVRRSCNDLTIQGRDDLVPASESDVLFPGINEIKLYTGVLYQAADRARYIPEEADYVPLGVFRIDQPKSTYADGIITISTSLLDRSAKIAAHRLTRPIVTAAGRPYWQAIRDLVRYADPSAVCNFAAVSYLTPQIVHDTGSDPWQEAQSMASAVGHDLAHDADGVCVLRPEPDPTTAPVSWSWVEGEDNLVLDGLEHALDGNYGYNHVVVRGITSTGEEGPVLAEAWDDNPNSPTYAGNPLGSSDYGDVPYFVSSSFVNTGAQALAYAKSTLLRVLGAASTVSGTAIVNPAMTDGDIVRIDWSPLKIHGNLVIASLSIPLEDRDMAFETNRMQVR